MNVLQSLFPVPTSALFAIGLSGFALGVILVWSASWLRRKIAGGAVREVRSLRIKRAVWATTLFVGFVSAIPMLVLSYRLGYVFWNQSGATRSAPSSSAADVGARVLQAPSDFNSTQGPSSTTQDAITNAMAAIGAVIAVVTLIMSLGVVWLADQQRKLDEKLLSVDRKLERLSCAEEVDRLRQRSLSLLVGAKVEAWSFVVRRYGAGPTANGLVHAVANDLESLMSEEVEIRIQGFHGLILYVRRGGQKLARVRAYTEVCHELVLARMFARSREQIGVKELVTMQNADVFCKVFSEDEVQKFLARMA